jgi:catechol 2,3-dioxygenase
MLSHPESLTVIFQRLQDSGYPLSGASDHGISEALYLEDPDQNCLELCWYKPCNQWQPKLDGSQDMYTRRPDIEDLMKELH